MPERYYIEHSLFFHETYHIFDRYPVLGDQWIEAHWSMENAQNRCDELNSEWKEQMRTCTLPMGILG